MFTVAISPPWHILNYASGLLSLENESRKLLVERVHWLLYPVQCVSYAYSFGSYYTFLPLALILYSASAEMLYAIGIHLQVPTTSDIHFTISVYTAFAYF